MKTGLRNILATPAPVSAGIALFSALALAGALVAEHVYGLAPCPLCIMQRIPYAFTLTAGLLGLLLSATGRFKKFAVIFVFMSSIAFLANSGVAFYHNGVERHWWESFLQGCRITFNTDGEPSSVLERIESLGPARCDEIPWQDPVLNLSMAAWNAITSFVLSVAAFTSSILIARRQNGL